MTKISKSDHDFFKYFDQYRRDRNTIAFENYQNNVLIYLTKLKSNNYTTDNIATSYYYKNGRLETLVEVSNGSSNLFSQLFYYDIFITERVDDVESYVDLHSSFCIYDFHLGSHLSSSISEKINSDKIKFETHLRKIQPNPNSQIAQNEDDDIKIPIIVGFVIFGLLFYFDRGIITLIFFFIGIPSLLLIYKLIQGNR